MELIIVQLFQFKMYVSIVFFLQCTKNAKKLFFIFSILYIADWNVSVYKSISKCWESLDGTLKVDILLKK